MLHLEKQSLENEVTQTVSALAQEGTCLIWLTETIGKGLFLEEETHPTSPLAFCPFLKPCSDWIFVTVLKYLVTAYPYFSPFFLVYFCGLWPEWKQIAEYSKKRAVLKVLPCHLNARNAVNLELTCTWNLETCWQCTLSVLPGITADCSCISRSHLTRAGCRYQGNTAVLCGTRQL